ncbi:metal-dependent hydrolase [Novosphingobium sp. M1R2S20]|uniref:Metal-dependent hydrolase n=1 Tax=Novosphingobium rhizovicinum TaxID=3228928 RepID=A0ABV3R6E5_9SPHN
MDNVTHSLTGWALAETGLKRRTRKGLAACVLGANMPDIDVFFGWAPWASLATHRGFTHGLVGGMLLMPPLLAGLLWLLDCVQVSRGVRFKSGLPMHFGWLLALCYLGALTHPLLDWQNTYAVQLLAPLSTRWYHNDALFIIDPWVLLSLALGIWLARKRRWQGHVRWPAVVALISMATYICVNGAISQLARGAPARGAPYARPEAVYASPDPLAFWRRTVLWRQDGMIAQGRFDPLRRLTELTSYTPPKPDGLSAPLVRRAMTANRDVIDYLRWSTMTTARVERNGCRATVIFGDERFPDQIDGRSFMESEATIDTCAGSQVNAKTP